MIHAAGQRRSPLGGAQVLKGMIVNEEIAFESDLADHIYRQHFLIYRYSLLHPPDLIDGFIQDTIPL